MQEYEVHATRKNGHSGVAACKLAKLEMDIDPAGRSDAFNPVELFLSAIAACMLKGIERAAPMIHFDLAGVDIYLKAVRQDVPPRIVAVTYELMVDTGESDHRIDLLHANVRKYGTIFNTVAKAVGLSGTITRSTNRL
jgi:uncharacterized OsmC-like protein